MKTINIIDQVKEVTSFTHYWSLKPDKCGNNIILTLNYITPITPFQRIFTQPGDSDPDFR